MHSLSGVTLALAITTAGLAGAPTIFDIEFDGGTVAQWIAAVQAKAPESNIMVQADGESVSVPALSLHSVSVQTCVELVGHIPGASCTEVGGGVAGASVWVIDAGRGSRHQRGRGRSVQADAGDATVVHQIPQGYRDFEGQTRLVDALDSVFLMSGGQAPKIAVLSDVGLIAVHGSPKQLASCSAVLDALPYHRSSAAPAEQVAAMSGRRSELLQQLKALSAARAEAGDSDEEIKREWMQTFKTLEAIETAATAQSP